MASLEKLYMWGECWLFVNICIVVPKQMRYDYLEAVRVPYEYRTELLVDTDGYRREVDRLEGA